MTDQQELQLLIGAAVGLIGAMTAGMLQYRIAIRNDDSRPRRLPGCLLLVSGWLGLVGLLVALVSLVLTGEMGPAIVPGMGVLAGFFVGSVAILCLWLLLHPGTVRNERR